MPEWEISFEEYLERIKLNLECFKEQLNLPKINSVKKVIPLRDMLKILSIISIKKDFLEKIIRGIKTIDQTLNPFKSSELGLIKVDPHHLKIGQKFVYRENYQGLLEDMPRIFDEFLTSVGFCDLGAFMIFGLDVRENYCLAYYLPPLIEKHEKEIIIMDGIHRNFINKQIGHTMNAILIEKIGAPFPCSVHSWKEIKIISLKDKPKDINKRYFDLNKNLFRDLKYLGIDG